MFIQWIILETNLATLLVPFLILIFATISAAVEKRYGRMRHQNGKVLRTLPPWPPKYMGLQCLFIYLVCDMGLCDLFIYLVCGPYGAMFIHIHRLWPRLCIEFLVCRYFRSRTTKVRKVQCLAIYLVCDRGYSTLINPSTRAPLWSDLVAYLLGTFPNNYIEYKNQMIKSRKYWVSSRFINIIYRTLTFFSTNDRDRNINIAFENSCKIKTVNVKPIGHAVLLFHSLSVPLFLFFHSLSLRYEILELKWKRSMLYISITVVLVYENFVLSMITMESKNKSWIVFKYLINNWKRKQKKIKKIKF